MRRLTPGLPVAALAAILVSTGAASAQPYPYNMPRYGVGFQPGLSPYLNLLRGGNTAANYYLGTIPEFERRQNSEVFRNALIQLDTKVSQETVELGLSAPIGTTGHVTAFGNTGGYFGSLTGRQAGVPQKQQAQVPGKKPQ
jgi:hypothetical protein